MFCDEAVLDESDWSWDLIKDLWIVRWFSASFFIGHFQYENSFQLVFLLAIYVHTSLHETSKSELESADEPQHRSDAATTLFHKHNPTWLLLFPKLERALNGQWMRWRRNRRQNTKWYIKTCFDCVSHTGNWSNTGHKNSKFS